MLCYLVALCELAARWRHSMGVSNTQNQTKCQPTDFLLLDFEFYLLAPQEVEWKEENDERPPIYEAASRCFQSLVYFIYLFVQYSLNITEYQISHSSQCLAKRLATWISLFALLLKLPTTTATTLWHDYYIGASNIISWSSRNNNNNNNILLSLHNSNNSNDDDDDDDSFGNVACCVFVWEQRNIDSLSISLYES